MKKHKHISRIDSHNSHCWFHRRVIGDKQVSKTFTDGVYGGKRKALSAAIAHDKRLDKDHGKFSRVGINLPIGTITNINNKTSDITGISLRKNIIERGTNTYEYHYWVASWREDGKRRQRCFSVNVHGDAGAFNKAVALREKKVKEQLANGKQLRPSSR